MNPGPPPGGPPPGPPHPPPVGYEQRNFGPPPLAPGMPLYYPPQPRVRPTWQRFLIAAAITIGITLAVAVVGILVIVGLVAWACGHH